MKDRPANTVKIAEFKAKLSEYLRGVRKGHVLTVMDRDTPVARVAPVEDRGNGGLVIRKATKKASEVKLPPPLRKPVHSVKWLLEDRESGR